MATQYTDASFVFTVKNLDLTALSHPHVTFSQGYTVVTVNTPTIIDATHFSVLLSQLQTGQFREGNAEVQLNWFDSSGLRHSTDIEPVTFKRNLLKRVITNE